MFRMGKLGWGIVIVTVAILFLQGGGHPLSGAAARKAQDASAKLERYEKQWKDEEAYRATLRRGENGPLAASLERDWGRSLRQADKHIRAARSVYRQRAGPLLKNNDAEDEAALMAAVKEIESELKQAQPLLTQGRARAEAMLAAVERVDQTARWASDQWDKAEAGLQQARARIADAKQKHPAKAADLTAYERELTSLADAVAAGVAVLQAQGRRAEPEVDRVAVAQAYDASNRGFTELNGKIARYSEEAQSLSHSLVRVLKDQKVEYSVRIGRSAWCESDGCGDGDTFLYPAKKVSPETYAGLEKHAGPIARYRPRLFSANLQIQVDAKVWAGLNIDPKKNWSGRYDHADYRLDNVQTKAFHQYAEVRDGELIQGGWTPVNMALFRRHERNLGMAIFTKPYGAFTSEASTQAEPAGMALIAEPKRENGVLTGSNAYGEWRTDSNGHSFWFYYGMGRILGDLLGGYRYRYDDWNRYRGRRHDRDYYGGGGWGTYGSNRRARDAVRSTDYYRRNSTRIDTGRSGGSGLRGAGPANRGRGPGGGGKF